VENKLRSAIFSKEGGVIACFAIILHGWYFDTKMPLIPAILSVYIMFCLEKKKLFNKN
jgi:hypothetical protein